MKYKIETHMHTKEVSPCGHVYAQEVVKIYAEAGYSTIIITDHYREDVIEHAVGTIEERVTHFLSGYKKAKQVGEILGLNVLMSVELTFAGQTEDFLLYGITEELLYKNPYLYTWTLRQIYDFANQHGVLVVQAHPFRSYLKVAPAKFLHGVEVLNANPHHESQNEKALKFAQDNKLMKTAGSDSHELYGMALSGMVSDTPIVNMDEFIDGLKNNRFAIIEQ